MAKVIFGPDCPAPFQSSRQLKCRLDSNFVVYGGGNADRDMAEKELNLLKLASGCPT
jgi:hypothetical protein